jgi:hypothetical protein
MENIRPLGRAHRSHESRSTLAYPGRSDSVGVELTEDGVVEPQRTGRRAMGAQRHCAR